MSKKEIAYFKKYGFCPHFAECFDSTGCNGKVYEFCRCRARNVKPEDLLPESKEKVRFT